MKKNNDTIPRFERTPQEPPSPQAILEAANAARLAERNPLAYSMGEPLPGRSMLDKLRARQLLDDARRIAEADDGESDTPIVRKRAASNTRQAPRASRAQYGITDTISPCHTINTGRVGSARHHD